MIKRGEVELREDCEHRDGADNVAGARVEAVVREVERAEVREHDWVGAVAAGAQKLVALAAGEKVGVEPSPRVFGFGELVLPRRGQPAGELVAA